MGIFSETKEAPADPILGLTVAYNADTFPQKVNLGAGAYRTEEGKPYVLEVVRRVEEQMLSELGTKINKEYSPIDGPPELKRLTQELCFGPSCPAVREGRVASVQALSGTGALRVVCEFARAHLPQSDEWAHEMFVPDPTWGNHNAIFAKAGLNVRSYPYYNEASRDLDFKGMMAKLRTAKPGAMVLLHACAHNPTGVDPSEGQWRQIASVVKERKLVPILDSAYQGYASGNLEKDAFAIRLFESCGVEFFLCQSFAKNLGLYGERTGMVHVITSDADHARAVLSQLKRIVRPMYSSPPIHGAWLVMKILGDKGNFDAWKAELASMANRVNDMRTMLRDGLEKKGTPGTWRHITDQIGMFSYTGLTKKMCERLIKDHHVYLVGAGRMNMAGLNRSNMQYTIDSIDTVVRAFHAEELAEQKKKADKSASGAVAAPAAGTPPRSRL